MRACATAGGGVMFIPDELETEARASAQQITVSYRDLAGEEQHQDSPQSFGRKKDEVDKKAVA